MLKVGLTGSIAVGKSFVANVFAELGCHVIDADATAREVVEIGTAGLEKVVAAFGENILNEDGSLNRTKLGNIVFKNEPKRKLLNSILHPLIIATYNKQIEKWESEDPVGIAIVDAALMIESGSYKMFDKIIVVFCSSEIQQSRLMKRNNLTMKEALSRTTIQMPQEEKKKYADFLIDTSGDFEKTRKQVETVYKELKELVKK